jgi:stearoyl-CoA desaturase (delta-9 desaturase)
MTGRERDWTNILFLLVTPVIGLGGTALYASLHGVAWWEPLLFLTLYLAVGLAVGSGYHRCFAHRAFECHRGVETAFLVLGALAMEYSALRWVRDHRAHHRFLDTDLDPHNIGRGAAWAHLLWLFHKGPADDGFENVPDLRANPRVLWQHRWFLPLSLGLGLGIPTLVGALLGRPLGGLLWGGFLRIVLVHQATFSVNSLAHLWGSRPYSLAHSARDNAFVAFFTLGEGYHNFHHTFPSDYRYGVRWYQWDPNKWLIRALEAAGLAWNLRATPSSAIDEARLSVLGNTAGARPAVS